MQPIQAIICFNGGSAGDLIKKLALLCHNIQTGVVRTNGMVELSQYFKNFFTSTYYENLDFDSIDWDQVYLIENSHFYSDQFVNIAQRLYFIDYPDETNKVIMAEYLRKRHGGSWENFLERHIDTLPPAFRTKINVSNCQQVFEIQWLKNIKSWRANPNLTPIQFHDILKRETILPIVEEVAGTKVKDIDKFDAVYTQWLESNSVFAELGR